MVSQEWKERFESAKQKHLDARKKEQGEGLTRIHGGLLRIPQDVFDRLGGKATELEATRVCVTCGMIAPKLFVNGYMPQKCACEHKALEEDANQQNRLRQWEVQQARLRKQCERCYTWLGAKWSETGLASKSFLNFDHTLQSKGYAAALLFAETPEGNVILWSDESWGTGKTHVAAAICNELLAQNIPCLFATGQNIFNAFGERFDNHKGVDDLIEAAGSTPLLVIDDLDKTHIPAGSEYKMKVFFNILNFRYQRKLPTIITTNAHVQVTYNDIEGVSEYIGRAAASRLSEGLQVIDMNGEDYRKRKSGV